MEAFGVGGVVTITAVCYLVALVVKASNIENKWIPIVCGVAGGILGLAGMYIVKDFPATDFLTALAVGIASGLAATGADQAVKQLSGVYNNEEQSDLNR